MCEILVVNVALHVCFFPPEVCITPRSADYLYHPQFIFRSSNLSYASLGCKAWRMVSLSRTRDLALTSALLEKKDYAADLRATFGAGVSYILQPAGVQIETSGGMVEHDTTSTGINLAVSVNRADAAGMAAAMSRFGAIAALGTPAFRTWLLQAELLPKFAMAALGVTDPVAFEGMMEVRATGEGHLCLLLI